MIPDFASWADHSNPEQGRTAGLILDLSRLRAEFVEPEMRFRKALEGIDLNGPCDLATPLTKAIDEMEYEMAVAVCSTRLIQTKHIDHHLLLLRFLVLSAWAERDCKPVILEQSLKDLSAVLELPKSHSIFANRSRPQLLKDRKRLQRMHSELVAWYEFEVEMMRRLSWEALLYKRGILRALLRKTVNWEALYEAHLAADAELNSLCVKSDGTFGIAPKKGVRTAKTVKQLPLPAPASIAMTQTTNSQDASTSHELDNPIDYYHGRELLSVSLTSQYSKITATLNHTRRPALSPFPKAPPVSASANATPTASTAAKGKGKAKALVQ